MKLELEALAQGDEILELHCRPIGGSVERGSASADPPDADTYLEGLEKEHGRPLLIRPGTVGVAMTVDTSFLDGRTLVRMSCATDGQRARCHWANVSGPDADTRHASSLEPAKVSAALDELARLGLWKLKSYQPSRALPLEHRTVTVFAKRPGGERRRAWITAPELHRSKRVPTLIERIEELCRPPA